MRHSTHQRLASHLTPFFAYKGARTQIRRCRAIPMLLLLSRCVSTTDRTHLGCRRPACTDVVFKLWLRELVDPLVPSEMYNECIAFANDAEACCAAVERLPTANCRVMLFV